MSRNLLAIAAGAVLWAALWCTANFAVATAFPHAFGADGSLHHAPILVGFVAWSVLLSVLAGATTARVGRGARGPVIVLAMLQLSIGTAVEIAWWNLLPVWYHLTFLALLVPGVLVGGTLGQRRAIAQRVV